MTHTSASIETLLLDVPKESRECLQKDLPVWQLWQDYVVKFTTPQSAHDHEINEQMARALGLKTVSTHAFEVSTDVAAQYESDLTGVVFMSFSKGERMDRHHDKLNPGQRFDLYKRISPDLIVCSILGNMGDMNKTNFMIENDQPVMIDTQFGIMGIGYMLSVSGMIADYKYSPSIYPHFCYDFQPATLIKAAHRGKDNFNRAIMTEELSHLTQYQPVIEERHEELVRQFEKDSSLRAKPHTLFL